MSASKTIVIINFVLVWLPFWLRKINGASFANQSLSDIEQNQSKHKILFDIVSYEENKSHFQND